MNVSFERAVKEWAGTGWSLPLSASFVHLPPPHVVLGSRWWTWSQKQGSVPPSASLHLSVPRLLEQKEERGRQCGGEESAGLGGGAEWWARESEEVGSRALAGCCRLWAARGKLSSVVETGTRTECLGTHSQESQSAAGIQ